MSSMMCPCCNKVKLTLVRNNIVNQSLWIYRCNQCNYMIPYGELHSDCDDLGGELIGL